MRATTGELPADLLELQRLMVTMTRARRAVFPSRPVALASYARKPPYAGVLASSLLAYVDHGFVDTPDGQVTLRCAPEVEARIFATTHDHDLAQRLGDITCPVYVVLGDETSPEQRRGSAELAEIFGIPARVLDGADHFGPLAQPSRFAAVVREAVAAAGLPTAAGVIT
jgi:pimeloyl-ACP methyl ester carboxylesterase